MKNFSQKETEGTEEVPAWSFSCFFSFPEQLGIFQRQDAKLAKVDWMSGLRRFSWRSWRLAEKRIIHTRNREIFSYLHAMPNIAEVIENALALPMVDRSYVASKLIESLESDELSEESIAGYDQRVASWKAGKNPSSSSQELDAKVQAILQS